MLHLDANEPQEAVKLLNRALALDPPDHASRYHLVAAYRRLGQSSAAQREQKLFEQTQKDFEEISRLNKEATKDLWDASVRLRLAELCEKHEMHQMAKMWRNAAARCLAQPGGDNPGKPSGQVMQIPPGG